MKHTKSTNPDTMEHKEYNLIDHQHLKMGWLNMQKSFIEHTKNII